MPDKEKKKRKKKGAEPEAAAPVEEAVNEVQAAPPAPEPNQSKSLAAELTGAQKAAAVIVALGVEKASLLYQHMEPEEIEQVTIEVAKLGFLDADVTEEVLTEFYQMCMTNKAVTEGGIEYARTVLQKAFGDQAANTLLEKVTKASDKDLFSALQHERPQTIALVLSYVDPDKAAAVIEQLEGRRQIQVVESIAQMDSASPAAIKIIEAEMTRRFANIFNNNNVQVGGIDFVADVMNNLDRSSEKTIFDGLNAYNDELAEEIRKRMFVFEDIMTMDDRSVQRFVRDCDPRDLVLALKAANEEVQGKLFRNMSGRMAESIRDDLEVTSNVRMKDVEDAQQRIVNIIRGLEEKGEVIIMKGGKDDIIA